MTVQYARIVANLEKLRITNLKPYEIQQIRVSKLRILINNCLEKTKPKKKQTLPRRPIRCKIPRCRNKSYIIKTSQLWVCQRHNKPEAK